MFKKLFAPVTVFLFLVVPFMATSFAAGAAAPADGTLLDLLKPVWDAATGHHWWLAASLGLIAGVAALKKYAPAGKLQDFVHSNIGASAMLLVISFAGALATGLVAAGTDAVSMSMVWASLQVAVGAAGGYALIKNLLVDPLLASKWYNEKAPAWLKAIMSIATWAFTKPDVGAEATKVGDEAVKNNPSPGADAPAGTPVDL